MPRQQLRRNRRRRRSRRGIKVLELILVTPIILLALLGTVEYGLLNITHAAVTQAATVGAREAAKLNPLDEIVLDEVVGRVNQILVANEIVITDVPGSGTRLVIEDGSDPLNPKFTQRPRCLRDGIGKIVRG